MSSQIKSMLFLLTDTMKMKLDHKYANSTINQTKNAKVQTYKQCIPINELKVCWLCNMDAQIPPGELYVPPNINEEQRNGIEILTNHIMHMAYKNHGAFNAPTWSTPP